MKYHSIIILLVFCDALLLWLIKNVLSEIRGGLIDLEHLSLADQSNCRIILKYGLKSDIAGVLIYLQCRTLLVPAFPHQPRSQSRYGSQG